MVEIIVNNESLDLLKGEVISLTVEVNNIGDLSKTKGDYSNSFKVPSTARNLGILGFVNDVNSTRSTTNRFLSCSLKQDGATFRIGFLSIDKYDNEKETIEITFYGGNVSWFDALKEAELRDVDLTEWEHTYDINTITASFNNTEGYIYPLVNNGRMTENTTFVTDIYDWLPATYVHTLVNNIFRDLGYKVKGSLINSDLYKKLVLPYALKELNLFNTTDTNDRLFQATNDTSSLQVFNIVNPGDEVRLDIPIIVSGNNGGFYDTSTDRYTVDWGGYVDIFFQAVCNFSSIATADLEIVVKKNGVDHVVKPFATGAGTGTPSAGIAGSYAVVDGDYFESYLRYSATAPTVADTVTVQSATARVNSTKAIVEFSRVYLPATLPQIKQADLISTIINMFGIIAQENAYTKEIEFNFFSDVKKNISQSVDWSDKVDLKDKPKLEFGKILQGYGSNNYFRYKDNDDDDALSNYVDVYNENLGTGFFNLDLDGVYGDKDIFESEFSPTIEAPCFYDSATEVQDFIAYIPRFSEASLLFDEYDIDPKPRILICLPNTYMSQITRNFSIGIRYAGLTLTAIADQIPYVYFDKALKGTEIDQTRDSLLFGSNNPIEDTSNNLLDIYYQDYVDVISNPKVLSCLVDLNPIDMSTLDLMKPVYLSQYNAYFYINKIDGYTAGADTTRVELIKL